MRRLTTAVLACVVCTASLADTTVPVPAEELVLAVTVNGAPNDAAVVRRAADGDVLMTRDDLSALALSFLSSSSGQWISLRSLYPFVTFEVKEGAAELRLVVHRDLVQRRDAARPLPLTAAHSAFLNYAFRRTQTRAASSWSAPWEAGMRSGDYLFTSTFTSGSGSRSLRRGVTTVTRDDEKHLAREIAGDFVASTGRLGGGGAFAGVSIASKFALRPDFIRFPGLTVGRIVDAPSQMEIYANGSLLRTEALAPGEINEIALPLSGANDVTVIITDAFGRREVIALPVYLSSSLLEPGVHDYSYNLGWRRVGEDGGRLRYDRDLTFMAAHRVGLTRHLTGSYRAEVTRNMSSGGISVTSASRRAGQVEAALAMSSSDEGAGHAWAASYSFSRRSRGVLVAASGYSPHYTNISMPTDADRSRIESLLQVSVRDRAHGSVALRAFVQRPYSGAPRTDVGVTYSRSLHRVSLYGSLERHLRGQHGSEVAVSVSLPLPGSAIASARFTTGSGGTSATTDYRHTVAMGEGIGYAVSAGDGTGRAEVDYHGAYGIQSVEYHQSSQSLTLATSGSVVLTGGAMALGRPVSGAFALVTTDVKGVEVRQQQQLVGRTNSAGRLVVPSLPAYANARVSIASGGLPLEYTAGRTDYRIRLAERGGMRMTFGIARLRAIEGRFVMSDHGKLEPLQMKRFTVDTATESITGRDGVFYLENLPAGRHVARVETSTGSAICRFVVAERNEIEVDIGTVVCEVTGD